MDDNKKKMFDIFDDDFFGLLDEKSKTTSVRNEDERLIDSYREITEFFTQNNREPGQGGSVREASLYFRLIGVRESSVKTNILKEYDIHNLLNKPIEKEVKSIHDILNNDSLEILNSEADDIFILNNVPKKTTMPDYVASRKSCKDFKYFENMFKQCQLDLACGKRKLYPFKNEQQIEKGYFFVLKGILLFVADIGKKQIENGRKNTRLRCVFENGTESDMLLRSLSAELYKDGRRVTEHEDKLLDNFNNISKEDEESGFIYILKSKSDKAEIKAIDNLYKIGYSTMAVEDRIKNAEQEPTYLMAPVSIVTVFKCYNMNPQKLEQLLHSFFGVACLNIDIYDKNGIRHSPREWFIAPISIIEDAIVFILNGEIIDYKYDSTRQIIIGK